MDLVLNRKEREALCKLLEIAPNCYGNIPLMKAAFKRSCLKHHPDKGGNPVIMMELNTLWRPTGYLVSDSLDLIVSAA